MKITSLCQIKYLMEHIDILKKKYLKGSRLYNSKNYVEPRRGAFRVKSKVNYARDCAHRLNIFRTIFIHEQHNLPYPVYQYALTLSPKIPSVEVSTQEYLQAISIMKGQYACIKSILYVEEVSSRGKRHIHGIILCTDKCKFRKFARNTRFAYKVDDITFIDGWLAYILNDSPHELITLDH